MKTTLLMISMLFALAAFAEDGNKKKPAPAAKGSPLTLPKEAVEVEPYTWRHKDTEGKVWIYRQTPFGLVRFEEEKPTVKTEKPDARTPALAAFEEGDQIRFERQGPFGTYRWFRKKTELTAEEREAWESAKKATAGKNSAPKE